MISKSLPASYLRLTHYVCLLQFYASQTSLVQYKIRAYISTLNKNHGINDLFHLTDHTHFSFQKN